MAITSTIPPKIRNFKDRSEKSEVMLAPNTLRMPISLTRCSAVNVDRPIKPRHEIKIASRVNIFESRPTRYSLV